MSNDKQISKQAYEQAQKELLEDRVKEIKGYILKTLEKIEDKKKEREKINEEIRILDLDLKELREGKFDKIEERLEKSPIARGVSAIQIIHINSAAPYIGTFTTGGLGTYSSGGTNMLCGSMGTDVTTSNSNDWLTLTAGTYQTRKGKVFYL